MKFVNAKMAVWKNWVWKVLVFGAAISIATPAVPQGQGQGQGQNPPVIKAEVNLVNLFATVRDKNKRVVTDLQKEDFKIHEDGHDEQLAFFSREMTMPITLGLFAGHVWQRTRTCWATIQEAGARFLRRVMRKGDEAMIISFDTDVDLLSDFTDDRSILDRAINKARINTPGGGYIAGNPGPIGSDNVTGTALYDAIYLACGDKLNGEAGRKAIVIVTDAQDEGSKVKLEEAIEAAQRTDTVIHVCWLLIPDMEEIARSRSGLRMIPAGA